MTDRTRNLILGLLLLLAAAVGLLTSYYQNPDTGPLTPPSPVPSSSASTLPPSPLPSPSPSTSPAVSPSPTPAPTPSPSAAPLALVATRGVKETPNWATTQELIASRNEVAYLLVKKNTPGCEPINVAGLPADTTARGYEVGFYTTTISSTKGGRIGAWADPLTPTTNFCAGKTLWLDIAVGKAANSGTFQLSVNSAPVTLLVTDRTMPDSPTMPLYMEMGGFVAMQAQGYPKTSSVAIEGPVHQAYNKVLRANRIEPIKQSIVGVPADLNEWSSSGGSYKQLVLDGRIAPPCLLSPTGTYGGGGLYSTTILTRIQGHLASGALPADSWGYIRDEDGAQYDAQIIPIFNQVKAAVPSLRRMMTENRASLDAYVTDPVFDFESWTTVPTAARSQNRTNFWLYGACQSQGTCSNAVQGTPTGSPMMLIDSPGAHQRAYPLVGKLAGARAMLYYNTTEALITAWQVDGQRRFGGHGDGTQLYPTTEFNPPIESVRMKLNRQGMFDAEYIEWAGQSHAAVVAIKDRLAVMKMTATEQDLEELHNALALSTNGLIQKLRIMVGL